jgi:hypothetical protein
MKYNDVVEYVQNGVAVSALVLHSAMQPKLDRNLTPITTAEGAQITEEHLTLVYLDPIDPGTTGDAQRAAVKTAYGVRPLSDDKVVGYKRALVMIDGETIPQHVHTAIVKPLEDEIFHLRSKVHSLTLEAEAKLHIGGDNAPTPILNAPIALEPPQGDSTSTEPSAADLDAVAKDQQAKEATAGEQKADSPEQSASTAISTDQSSAPAEGGANQATSAPDVPTEAFAYAKATQAATEVISGGGANVQEPASN